MGDFFEAMRDIDSPGAKMGRRTRSAPEVLHSMIVWAAWCEIEGGEATLYAKYRSRRNGGDHDLAFRSDELGSYKAGRRSLSGERRAVLGRRYPSLRRLMEWPMKLFDVDSTDQRLAQKYLKSSFEEAFIWPRHVFPGDEDAIGALNRRPVGYLDLERLFERGDDYGFFTILAAFRLFGFEKERDQQWHAAKYLIKAAPGLCRLSFVRPFSESFIDLIDHLLVLLPDTSFVLEIDREEMRRQILAATYEPCRDTRLASLAKGTRIEEPPDPIVPYTYRRCSPEERPMLMAGSQGAQMSDQDSGL